jgi:predicted PurR-regulated permease PerM
MLLIVVVAALLPRYRTAVEAFQRLSPLGYDVSELYSRKISAMVSSLIKGVFLIAIIQGAAMGVFYWLAGLPYIFMLIMLSILLAMIPLVGISWLAIAIAVVSFLTGNPLQGLIVLGGFYGVVNWIDILLRPKLLSEEAYIPLALFLLSIFGGLAWAGVMGLFYGPVIMLLLVTTIQIYAEQYAREDGTRLATAIGSLVTDQEGKPEKRTRETED